MLNKKVLWGASILLLVDNLVNEVLSDVSFELKKAECLSISGPSGSGKSCLLRALADLDPYQGHVGLNGIACKDIEPQQWRRKVAYLPAESAWWGEQVKDHFLHEAIAGLDALGLDEGIMSWSVSRLSTGERQRMALLRLLDRAPDVLLLDEPTASLDADNIARVESLIKSWQRQHGASVLWVSHSVEQIARVADRGLRMLDGGLLMEVAND
ncbi:MAG: ATP-binding cassette domain-containing protein [Gammaproteobacteria bacterium]|nr:ATP-binding cassette domain-containing protein [Gammaproteobacteria bacterium]